MKQKNPSNVIYATQIILHIPIYVNEHLESVHENKRNCFGMKCAITFVIKAQW